MSLLPSPRITIITSSHRDLAGLQRTHESLLSQRLPQVQWVVVDSGSGDGTAAWLQAQASDWIRWVSEPDQGIYDAWNKGLRLAQGEWIVFVGAGDLVLNLQAMLQAASDPVSASHPERLRYGPVRISNAQGQALYTLGEPWEQIKPQMPQVMRLPHPALLHHRSLFDECGGFDASFRIAGDYELLLRCLQRTQARFHPTAPWVAMHLGGVSTQPAQAMRQLQEVRRAQLQNGIAQAGPLWKAAVMRVRVRLWLSRLLPEPWVHHLLDWGRKLQGKPAHWTRS